MITTPLLTQKMSKPLSQGYASENAVFKPWFEIVKL
jgi:hypothetical protein